MIQIYFSAQLKEKYLELVGQIAASKGNVTNFNRELMAEVCVHTIHKMPDENDWLESWETTQLNFEAGLAIGASLKPEDQVFDFFVNDDEYGKAGLCGSYLFYFQAKSEEVVLRRLAEAGLKWIQEDRRRRGLLPFVV